MWVRNAGVSAILLACYTITLALNGLFGFFSSLGLLFALIVAAGAAAIWANVRLGPVIGWSRGGLPVVIVLVFAALVAYALATFYAGQWVYGLAATSDAIG